MKKIIRSITVFILLLGVYYAQACSVCGTDYTDEEIKAYTFITFLLMFLPIGAFGFLGIWIGRKYLKYDRENT
jgi:hypothetical protein